MLESVTIRNFQSLKETTVEFGTLTVIVGQNDLGKSALFRAIKAAAEAQAGTSFVTYGETKTLVEIKVDGHTLEWVKGPTTNRYYLDGVLYDKVGSTVPPDIDALLGLGPVQFDKDLKLNLNFADQEDPPFLIPFPGGMTSASVAKVLGDLTNLNLLFRAVHEADRQRKGAETSREYKRTDYMKRVQELESYADLASQVDIHNQIQALYVSCGEDFRRLVELETLRSRREALRDQHSNLLETKPGELPAADLSEVEVLAERLGQLKAWHSQLHDQELSVRVAQGQMESCSNQIGTWAEELAEILDGLEICPICERVMDHEHA